jgi:hypothetical protein
MVKGGFWLPVCEECTKQGQKNAHSLSFHDIYTLGELVY